MADIAFLLLDFLLGYHHYGFRFGPRQERLPPPFEIDQPEPPPIDSKQRNVFAVLAKCQ